VKLFEVIAFAEDLARLKRHDNQLIKLLHETGCREVGIGMESGDPKVLADMNKKYELAELPVYLKQFSELGIKPILYIIIGFPTENYVS
jgi:p-methyltransferase